MIVVADASPLNYLILIRQEGVLPQLFGEVLAPPAVLAELTDVRAPAGVRQWAADPPTWLTVRAPTHANPSLRLGPGETQAIALAQELHADVLLIDERRGATLARRYGLTVTGVLGVLEIADEHGLLELSHVLGELRATTFRVNERLIQQALERAAKRRSTQAPEAPREDSDDKKDKACS